MLPSYMKAVNSECDLDASYFSKEVHYRHILWLLTVASLGKG